MQHEVTATCSTHSSWQKSFNFEIKLEKRRFTFFFQGEILGSVPMGRWRRGHFSRPGLFWVMGNGENNVSPIFHLTNRWRGGTLGAEREEKKKRRTGGGKEEKSRALELIHHASCSTAKGWLQSGREGGLGFTDAQRGVDVRSLAGKKYNQQSRQAKESAYRTSSVFRPPPKYVYATLSTAEWGWEAREGSHLQRGNTVWPSQSPSGLHTYGNNWVVFKWGKGFNVTESPNEKSFSLKSSSSCVEATSSRVVTVSEQPVFKDKH